MIPTDTGHKDLRCNFKFYFVPTVSVIDFFLFSLGYKNFTKSAGQKL